MDSIEEAKYRLRLSEGFVKEAEEYFNLSHWRSCVSSAQLTVENASKAVLALFQPMVKIHDISKLLLSLIEEQGFMGDLAKKIERLAENARILGFEEHIRTDYGDELGYRTPWEIYNSNHAEKALSFAKISYKLSVEIIEELKQKWQYGREE